MKKNKKGIIKIISLFLVCVSILTCFASTGCASTGKPLMELDGTKISVNTFKFFLSRMKGNLSSSYYYGSKALDADFWDTIMDESGKTYNEHYTDVVLESTKTYLAALHLFEEFDLELPKSRMDAIEEELDNIINVDGGGSKAALNSVLSKYGANFDVLREAYVIEEKISYLREYLFGTNGSKISADYIEDYYENHFVRYKEIIFNTKKPAYEKDENGDEIYYTEDGKIAYDKENGVPKKNSDGTAVKDKDKNTVYVDVETGKIAYDVKTGARKQLRDSSGALMEEDYSSQKLLEIIDNASIVMDKTVDKDYTLFEALMKENTQELDENEYSQGYYAYAYSEAPSKDFVSELFDMDVGEVRMIKTDSAIHIVMKYKLEESGYALEENEKFFIGSKTGNYIFMSDLIDKLFADYLEKYLDDIEVKEKLLEGIDMKSVEANYDF